MKRFKVSWVEYHEEQVVAKNEDEAYEIASIDECAVTYKTSNLIEIEELGEEQQDPMELAHGESEEHGL